MPSKGKKKADVSFEDAVEKLESIVEEMESDELPLDKLLVRYEEGAKLVKACEDLLESDGEASSIALASRALAIYARLDDAQKQQFFVRLADDFAADAQQIDAAYEAYREARDNRTQQRLFDVCEPRRQELLRRLNLPSGGTHELVHMREDLLGMLSEHPDLRAIDADFAHLFASWFNRGFLVLRPIDWTTPANILEKIIRYEAVHAIDDWDALRDRLAPSDRRCFAFFHPATGDEPLVLYTNYSPPEHATGAVFATREEADAAEAAGEDEPPRS